MVRFINLNGYCDNRGKSIYDTERKQVFDIKKDDIPVAHVLQALTMLDRTSADWSESEREVLENKSYFSSELITFNSLADFKVIGYRPITLKNDFQKFNLRVRDNLSIPLIHRMASMDNTMLPAIQMIGESKLTWSYGQLYLDNELIYSVCVKAGSNLRNPQRRVTTYNHLYIREEDIVVYYNYDVLSKEKYKSFKTRFGNSIIKYFTELGVDLIFTTLDKYESKFHYEDTTLGDAKSVEELLVGDIYFRFRDSVTDCYEDGELSYNPTVFELSAEY